MFNIRMIGPLPVTPPCLHTRIARNNKKRSSIESQREQANEKREWCDGKEKAVKEWRRVFKNKIRRFCKCWWSLSGISGFKASSPTGKMSEKHNSGAPAACRYYSDRVTSSDFRILS